MVWGLEGQQSCTGQSSHCSLSFAKTEAFTQITQQNHWLRCFLPTAKHKGWQILTPASSSLQQWREMCWLCSGTEVTA